MKPVRHTQSAQPIVPNSVKRRLQHSQRETPVRGVVQDKPRATSAPPASRQPAPLKKETRTAPIGDKNNSFTNSPRKRSTSRQKEKLYIWVEAYEKKELERIAESEGLSLSSAGRGMIIDGIRQRLRIEREVFSQPVLERTIRSELRRSFSRMIIFQARIAMTLDVIKGLIKWLCRRIAGATKEQVDAVEERSRTDARINLQSKSPQLERISKELEQTLMEGIN
jgi:hypothetical protein